jgi:hypothetical protein
MSNLSGLASPGSELRKWEERENFQPPVFNFWPRSSNASAAADRVVTVASAQLFPGQKELFLEVVELQQGRESQGMLRIAGAPADLQFDPADHEQEVFFGETGLVEIEPRPVPAHAKRQIEAGRLAIAE